KASIDEAAIGSHRNAAPISLNIINSSFYGNAYTGTGGTGQGTVGGDNQTTLTIVNSVLYGDHTPVEISTANVPASLSVSSSDIAGGFAGSGNINADPLYLNPTGGDLRLAPPSPAINRGTTGASVPTTDFLGNARDLPPDMGAYEYELAVT